MMNLEKIEVLVKPYPISNNEYVSYILQLSKYSQKQQQLFKNFYLEIIKKAIKLNETDDFPVENYRIWINGEKISPQIIEQLNLKLAIKALNELEINHYQEEIPQKETPSPVTYQLSNAEEYFLTRLKK